MAQDNFLYQGKEGMYPLPEKSRLAYMKTWISPRAWKSYLSTGQLSPEFKGFLSSASAASVTLVPFVAGSAVGILVGTAGSHIVHRLAFEVLIKGHNSYSAIALEQSTSRFADISTCYVYLRELRIDRVFVGLPGVSGEVAEITTYLKKLPTIFPDISSKLIIK